MMKKSKFALFLISLGLVFSFSLGYAEMTKEGSGDYKSGKSGSFEILKLGKGRLQMNWEERGVMVEAPANSPVTHASYYSIGSLYAIEGKFKSMGGIVFTRPNGDQIFGTLNTAGILGVGANSGLVEFTGGTGECHNIEGRMEFSPRPKVKSSKKGTYQGIGLGKVSWKIP